MHTMKVQESPHACLYASQHQLFQIKDFQLQLKIGEGAFACVSRAVHKKTGHVIALKIYEKKNLRDVLMATSLKREIKALEFLSHKNIMSLHEVIENRTNIYLVMELCEGKSLYHLVKNQNNKKQPGLPENYVRKIFKQIIEGMAYMHSQQIVHRDLKLDNILISHRDEVKIIDFGFAVSCDPQERLTTYCGTPHYMDPNLVRKTPYSGQAADVWASGIILFLLLTGHFPFLAKFQQDLFRKIYQAKFEFPRNMRQGTQDVESILSP